MDLILSLVILIATIHSRLEKHLKIGRHRTKKGLDEHLFLHELRTMKCNETTYQSRFAVSHFHRKGVHETLFLSFWKTKKAPEEHSSPSIEGKQMMHFSHRCNQVLYFLKSCTFLHRNPFYFSFPPSFTVIFIAKKMKVTTQENILCLTSSFFQNFLTHILSSLSLSLSF